MLKTDNNPFTVNVGGQKLDYRVKEDLDLNQIKKVLEAKGWWVIELAQPHRNVVGVLEKDGKRFRLKLAGSSGMGVLVKNEVEFLTQASDLLPKDLVVLPTLVEFGEFKLNNQTYPYFIVKELPGKPLVNYPETKDTAQLVPFIDQIIQTAEAVSRLPFSLKARDYAGEGDYKDFFLSKTRKWLMAVTEEIREKYQLNALFDIVKAGTPSLAKNFRHGDFAPWHILLLDDKRLGLVDFEHATSEGVQYYDIAYFIQRVFQVLQDENLAKEVYNRLISRDYDQEKLKTVLASRAIGGFLDEQVGEGNFAQAERFKEWVLSVKS